MHDRDDKKLSLCLIKSHAMKNCPFLNSALRHQDVWMSGGKTPHILNVDSFTTRPLYSRGKNPPPAPTG